MIFIIEIVVRNLRKYFSMLFMSSSSFVWFGLLGAWRTRTCRYSLRVRCCRCTGWYWLFAASSSGRCFKVASQCRISTRFTWSLIRRQMAGFIARFWSRPSCLEPDHRFSFISGIRRWKNSAAREVPSACWGLELQLTVSWILFDQVRLMQVQVQHSRKDFACRKHLKTLIAD